MADQPTETETNATPPKRYKGESTKKAAFAISVALAVAIALILLGYLTYSVANEKDEEAPQTQEQNETAEDDSADTSSPANPEDIDNLDQEFDATLQELDNNEDFSEEEMSDESLGL